MRTATDVLIAGGGPVGLQLASELQCRGIDHLIVEQRPQPDAFCKALGITPRTLEMWDHIGVLPDFLNVGTFMLGVQAVVNGADAGTESIELGSMPYGFMTIPQYEAERLLRAHLRRHGGRVEQGVTLVGFEAGAGDQAWLRLAVAEPFQFRQQQVGPFAVAGQPGDARKGQVAGDEMVGRNAVAHHRQV